MPWIRHLQGLATCPAFLLENAIDKNWQVVSDLESEMNISTLRDMLNCDMRN